MHQYYHNTPIVRYIHELGRDSNLTEDAVGNLWHEILRMHFVDDYSTTISSLTNEPSSIFTIQGTLANGFKTVRIAAQPKSSDDPPPTPFFTFVAKGVAYEKFDCAWRAGRTILEDALIKAHKDCKVQPFPSGLLHGAVAVGQLVRFYSYSPQRGMLAWSPNQRDTVWHVWESREKIAEFLDNAREHVLKRREKVQ